MAQDSGNNVDIEFGAQTDDASSKIKDLGSTIQDAMGKAGESFGGFSALTVAAGTAIEHLGSMIGEKLVEMIKQSIMMFGELGGELEHLQHRLGMSGEELSVLKVGLESVGISASTFESIARRLPQVLQKNSELFDKAGIAYKDSNGELLSVQDTIINITRHLENFSAGSARNQEGVRLMGRAYYMMADTVEITSEKMKEASDVAHEFGLVLSNEDIEAADVFERKVSLLQQGMKGFYIEISRALTPALTTLAQVIRDWLVPIFDSFSVIVQTTASVLSSLWDVVESLGHVVGTVFAMMTDEITGAIGPGGEGISALEFFRNVLAIVSIALIAFRTGFVVVFSVIANVIEVASITLRQFSAVASSALRMDWAGIQAAWDKGTSDISASVSRMTKKIMDESIRGNKEMTQLLETGTLHGPQEVKSTGGGGTFTPKEDKTKTKSAGGDTRMALWRQELKEITETEANFFGNSLKEEEKFWQNKLGLIRTNSKADVKLRSEVRTQLFNIHKQLAQQELAQDLADIKSQVDIFQKGSAERIRIAILTAERIKLAYGSESTQYKAQIQEINKLQVDQLNETIKLMNMRTDRVKDHNLHELAMEEEKLSHRKNMGQITDLEELAALKVLTEKKYQIEVQAQRQKIELMYGDVEAQQAAYDKLDEMAEKHTEDMQKISNRMSKANMDEIKKWLDPVTSAFSQTVTGIIQGTTTIQDGFKNMGQSIVLEFNKVCLEIIAKWIATQLQMQMESSMGGGGGFFGNLFGGSGTGGSAGGGINLSGFKDYIPFLDGGTNYVPRDTLAVIHQGEAVTPAKYNTPGGTMMGGNINNHFHIQGAMDMRTQQQIALAAGLSVQRARARNG